MKPRSWFKLWGDVLHSFKVARLTDRQFRLWVGCLAAANAYDHDGGALPPLDRLAHELRQHPEALEAGLAGLTDAGLLDRIDGAYVVHDWRDWQAPADPTAADRMVRYRANLKAKADKGSRRSGTPQRNVTRNVTRDATDPVTPYREREQEREKDKEKEKTPPNPPRGGAGGWGDDEPRINPRDPGPIRASEAALPPPPPPPSPAEVARVKALCHRAQELWPMADAGAALDRVATLWPADWLEQAIERAAAKKSLRDPAGWITWQLQQWRGSGGPPAPTPEAPGQPTARVPYLDAAQKREAKNAAAGAAFERLFGKGAANA
jgi:hypothetical protein